MTRSDLRITVQSSHLNDNREKKHDRKAYKAHFDVLDTKNAMRKREKKKLTWPER